MDMSFGGHFSAYHTYEGKMELGSCFFTSSEDDPEACHSPSSPYICLILPECQALF